MKKMKTFKTMTINKKKKKNLENQKVKTKKK